MHDVRRLRRRIAGAVACVAIVASIGSAPAPASAADPLARLAFAVGDEELFSVSGVGGSPEVGTWSLTRGQLANGRIDLHLEIQTPTYDLPVLPGPAVLFAGFHLYGDAGGDVGLGGSTPTHVHVGVPACTDASACRYSVDISLPTTELPAAIDRLERDGSLIWVSTELTLVRTFGGGQWLQVLPLLAVDGPTGAAAGHLGDIRPTHGLLPSSGLFPADRAVVIPKGDFDLANDLDYAAITERLRRGAGDTSTPIPMNAVELRVAFDPTCAFYSELALHDPEGNLAFSTLAFGEREITGSTHLPVGRPWFLSLLDGGTINSPAVQLGPILAVGAPVAIDAAIDCAKRSGTLELTGAPTPTPIPTRPPLSSVGPPAATMAASSASTAVPGSAAPSEQPASSSGAVVAVALGALLAGIGILALLVLRRRPVRS